jgi:hypothetical protein
MLIQTIGVSAVTGLQSPEPVPGGSSDDVFFATRQVWLLATFRRAGACAMIRVRQCRTRVGGVLQGAHTHGETHTHFQCYPAFIKPAPNLCAFAFVSN